MRSRRSIVTVQFLTTKLRQVRKGNLFYVKHTKTLSFSLVAEILTNLVYHRSPGENSSFQFSSHLPDDGRSISQNDAKKQHDSRHDKLI